MSVQQFLQELSTDLIRNEQLDAEVLEVVLENVIAATAPMRNADTVETKLQTLARRKAAAK